MTLFKKSLSLLLALIMVFSSVHVMAFAATDDDWYLTDGKDNVAFEIKFFRNAGTSTNPNWIETEKVKPGEAVKARAYINTDFPTAQSGFSFAFNSKYFSVDEKAYPVGNTFALTANDDFEYSQGILEFKSGDSQAARTTDLKSFSYNKNNELVTNGYLTQEFSDNFDLITSPFVYVENDYAWILNYDPKYTGNWVFEYDLVVNADDYVKTPGRYGEGLVPAGDVETREGGTLNGGFLTTPATFKKFETPFAVNLFKYKSEKVYKWSESRSMTFWKANVTSTVGEVTVFSDILLDPNGGAFIGEGNKYNYDSQPITGVIGENYDPSSANAYKPVKSGMKFLGWNTDAQAEKPLTNFELSQILYDYEDKTLYAIYDEADEFYYSYKEYWMNPDGTYGEPFESEPIYGEENAPVNLEVVHADGWELDTAQNNILSGFIDNATVLVIYYKRVGYDVIYNVDANTKWSPDEKTLHDAPVPAYGGDDFEAPEGKKLIGWSVNENDTQVNVPATMPKETLNLYPVYADEDTYTYLFDANQGVFDNGTPDDTSDDETLKSLTFEKGAKPTEIKEVPVREGYDFAGWTPELPNEVTGDIIFKAEWEPQEFTITFVVTEGGEFADGTTANKEVAFNFGETVTGSEKVPADPSRDDGWNFLMWNPTLPETMPAKNIEVTSVWTKEPVYTVTFADSVNSNVVYGKTSGVEGTDITVPDVTDKNFGYNFAGWVLEGTTEVVTPDAKIAKEDKTYLATWTEAEYSITFDTNGGTPSTIPEIKADYKEDISDELPANPTLTGHRFVCWVDQNGNEYTSKEALPKTMPAGGLELKAIWEANKYNAIFITNANNGDKNGGGDVAGKFSNGKTEEIIPTEYKKPISAPPAPTAEGYTFSHWETSDRDTLLEDYPVMPDQTLIFYAQYTYNTTGTSHYDIVIYTENLDGTYTERRVENQSIETGKSVQVSTTGSSTADLTIDYAGLLTADEKKSQEPDATNANNVLKIDSASETTDNILVVYFQRKAVKATFNPNGGEFAVAGEDGIVEGAYGSALTAPELKDRKGYEGYTWEPEVPATLEEDGVTYKAIWTKKSANAIFYINGTVYKTVPYEYGDEVTAPEYTPEPGKTFSGWEGLPTTMGEKDLEFFATETTNEYKVTYEVTSPAEFADKAPVDSSVYKYNDKATVLAAPEVKGYEFKGWYLNGDKTKTYAADAEITLTDNVKLTGEYVKKNYSVQFNLDGGKYDGSSLIPSQDYAYNDKLVNLPEDTDKFVKENHEFIGWKDNQGNVYTSESTMPDGDLVLIAQWKEVIVPHDITYTYNISVEGAPALPGTTQALKDAVITLPSAPAVGDELGDYRFIGWTVNGVSQTGSFTMPNEKADVVGIWVKKDAKEYTVTVNANGGKFSNGETSKEYTFFEGQPITGIEIPVLDKHEHTGWNPVLPVTMPAENIEADATWKQTKFTITVDANGGTFKNGEETKEYVFEVGDKIVGIEIPANGEMIFDGWNPEIPNVMPEEDITVSAKWQEPAPDEYTIKVDPNGGTFPNGSTDPYEETVAEGDEISDLPGNPTKENHEFKGWLNTATGEVVDKLPEKMPSGNVTFVAQWEEIGKNTVTYYLVEGGAVYAQDTYREGDTIVLPKAPELEGFDFDGWVTDLEAGTKLPEKMGTEDIVAYAVLTPHVHSVTYYLDKEKTDVYKEYDEVMFGSEVPVPADPISSDATLIFAGWEPAPVSVMPDSDLEYVATWAKKPVAGEQFVAKFTVDGKTHALFVLEEGEEIPDVTEPTKFGFVFKGWEPSVPETMPGEDVEFVAQWELDKNIVYVVIGGTVVSGVVIGSIIGATNTAIITGAAIIGGVLVLWGVSELVKDTYTVTYMVDGEVYKTYKVIAGTKIPVPADPAKDGATFKGWNPDVPEKMPAEDLVFEATWSSDTNVEIPDTGSVAGATAFAVIAAAGAGAYLLTRKKKEDEEN